MIEDNIQLELEIRRVCSELESVLILILRQGVQDESL